MADFNFDLLEDDDLLLEELPEDVQASIELRDKWIASLPPSPGVDEFVVSDLQRWQPGSTVRVAFMGGNSELHGDIADVAATINELCNITLDFGKDEATGTCRTWSEDDNDYAAEIRVSFDQRGNFSLVGTDSVNPSIGLAVKPVGGRHYQRSLNLGGFHINRPITWKGTTLHEFMHALGFKHEHQSMRGPCKNEFRWEDDEGYEPTQDNRGKYIPDAAGRRPGIYTYLAGWPNSWPRWKVDHNLRTLTSPELTFSEFDRSSIMLYRFDRLFYKTDPSECAPSGDGQDLSEGDIRGLQHLYPAAGAQASAITGRRGALMSAVAQPEPELPGVESPVGVNTGGTFAREALKLLGRY